MTSFAVCCSILEYWEVVLSAVCVSLFRHGRGAIIPGDDIAGYKLGTIIALVLFIAASVMIPIGMYKITVGRTAGTCLGSLPEGQYAVDKVFMDKEEYYLIVRGAKNYTPTEATVQRCVELPKAAYVSMDGEPLWSSFPDELSEAELLTVRFENHTKRESGPEWSVESNMNLKVYNFVLNP